MLFLSRCFEGSRNAKEAVFLDLWNMKQKAICSSKTCYTSPADVASPPRIAATDIIDSIYDYTTILRLGCFIQKEAFRDKCRDTQST
jgi:hypothetical protein